ncbi:cation:proton antiporter [Candidatus Poriferisocius sp.]|uniref:cation:proton antiporter domain-containing protein n=1 Tax=Candidatus Poriferisocius sp. TaxID=3101276 RepID=UPI003B599409
MTVFAAETGGFDLLVFWVQILALVTAAHLFGLVMRRVGLPSVVGALLAGLVLGPSVFGVVWESGFEWFLPDVAEQTAALQAVSWVGVALLLVVTGFETDLGLISKLGRPALLVTAGSLVVPLIAGVVVGLMLPSVFLAEDAQRTTFTLFVALALSVSSLAVVAKILSELGLMRRDFGQITVAAGMANDVVGWVMLGVFTGLATSGEVSVGQVLSTLGGIAAFGVLALTVGQRVVDLFLRRVRRAGSSLAAALTVCMVTMLAFGVATEWLGVEAVLGAFVAGVVLNRSRFQHEEVIGHLEGLTGALFAPVFFATAGLQVDLRLLNDAEALWWALVLLLVGIVFKFAGAYGGARLAGRTHRAGLALGAGLNARGALEIVIATVGLGVGVFSPTAFSVIVLVPVITSLFASAMLRGVVNNWQGTPDEQERLGREQALSRNLVVRTSRLLLPSRGGPESIAAAQVLHFAWPIEAGATVLTVGARDAEVDIEPLRNVLYDRPLEHRRVRHDNPVQAVIDESRLGFGVIGLGAQDYEDTFQVISPLVDGVLSESPIPVVVVRRARNLDRPLPGAFSRAVVPVTGSPVSRAAQEVAFNLSAQLGTELHLTHVSATRGEPAGLPSLFSRRMILPRGDADVGERVVEQAMAHADELGATTRAAVLEGASPAEEILKLVQEIEADLVVMGAHLRRVGDRPFLGHRVEQVLRDCDATVVVVLIPFDL